MSQQVPSNIRDPRKPASDVPSLFDDVMACVKSPLAMARISIRDISSKLERFQGRFRDRAEANRVFMLCCLHHLYGVSMQSKQDKKLEQAVEEFRSNPPPFMNEDGFKQIKEHLAQQWRAIVFLSDLEDDVLPLQSIVSELVDHAFLTERAIRPHMQWIKESRPWTTPPSSPAAASMETDELEDAGIEAGGSISFDHKRVYGEFADLICELELLRATKKMKTL